MKCWKQALCKQWSGRRRESYGTPLFECTWSWRLPSLDTLSKRNQCQMYQNWSVQMSHRFSTVTCLLLKRCCGLSNTSKPFGRNGESSSAWQWIVFTTSFFGLNSHHIRTMLGLQSVKSSLVYTTHTRFIGLIMATVSILFMMLLLC